VERNLRSRLDAAREARRLSADLPTPAEGLVADEDDDAPTSSVIDLRTLREVREAGRRALTEPVHEDEQTTWVWEASPTASIATAARRRASSDGEPVTTTNPAQEHCPNCGGPVRIDLYDLIASVAHLTCIDCGFLFTARSPRA
jgi:hypothetical protein